MKYRRFQRHLENAYRSFNTNIEAKLLKCGIQQGALIFSIKVLPGTKVENIFNQAQNIQACLGVPVFRPFVMNNEIYLVVAMRKPVSNKLMPILTSPQFHNTLYKLPIAIGYDEFGVPVIDGLANMTHVLYVGSTNSGKSTGLISMILCLILTQKVSALNLIIFDVGATSLQEFEDVPHLAHPIVKDKIVGIYVLKELTKEMERRINLPPNEVNSLPALVCVIDEFTSLISNLGDKELSEQYKNAINNLLRRGRKANIHMVLATQNATQEAMQVDIGNITTRLVFRLSSSQSSKFIIGETGAEKLPGRGAMLYRSSCMTNAMYLQGAYVSDEELQEWVHKLKSAHPDISGRFSIPIKDCAVQFFQDSLGAPQPIIEDKSSLELSKIILWVLSRNSVSANAMQE
ncbi:MAG: FtsK/SpoIIIE domain-containing protein, partial [Oscillospiraceae bacterium]